MAAKPLMGKLLPFPDRSGRGAKSQLLDEVSGQMIAAEHALFVALRMAQKRLPQGGRSGKAQSSDQPPIQPPPRTSSSRKKTAA